MQPYPPLNAHLWAIIPPRLSYLTFLYFNEKNIVYDISKQMLFLQNRKTYCQNTWIFTKKISFSPWSSFYIWNVKVVFLLKKRVFTPNHGHVSIKKHPSVDAKCDLLRKRVARNSWMWYLCKFGSLNINTRTPIMTLNINGLLKVNCIILNVSKWREKGKGAWYEEQFNR